MDVKQLRAVRAIIEAGGVSRAAERINVTQPALTKTVRRLEEQLGVELFHRESRGMRPTAFGELLLAHAQSVEVSLNEAQAEMASLKTGTMGLVTIGASPLTASKVLPAAVARAVSQHPSLKVHIATINTDLIVGLLAGQYDFVVKVLGRESDRNIARKPLFKDRLLIVTRLGHPLARYRRILPQHLADFGWALPPPGSLHRGSLEQFFVSEGLPPPRGVVECSNTEVIVDVARRTDCLGLIAEISQRNKRSEGLRVLPFVSPFFIRTIGLSWRRTGRLSPASRLVMREIENNYPAQPRDSRSK